MVDVHGFVKPGFEGVRDAFADNFEKGLELGASCAVTKDGEFVVDLWAGDADPSGRAWEEDTIVNVYSTTKTMAAISVLLLADRGEIDLGMPVAKYWPEFAQKDKANITVSQIMSHSAGLSGFDPALPNTDLLYDWDACCERLAAQTPWWEPGTASGYHAITQGYLQGEIVRRVTGKSIGTFFREEIAGPLRADFHIGLDPEHDDRVGELIPPTYGIGQGSDTSDAPDKDSIANRTMQSAAITGNEPRTREWRAAEIPAAGGIGNARSVARVHSMMACGGEVDGIRIMSESGVERAREEQTRGKDLVMGAPLVFGNGFGLNDAKFPISPNERAFFWGGWGGSLAIIDLDARLSIAYVMNRMEANLMGDPRGVSLAMAAFGSVS
jgi:CubicO group peptidase (beta-lactamase class C family)